jgi:hypothetical protein
LFAGYDEVTKVNLDHASSSLGSMDRYFFKEILLDAILISFSSVQDTNLCVHARTRHGEGISKKILHKGLEKSVTTRRRTVLLAVDNATHVALARSFFYPFLPGKYVLLS